MGSIADYGCAKCGAYTTNTLCDVCRARPLHSEALVRAALLGEGVAIANPVDPAAPFDLLACGDEGVWLKVQVKTAYSDKGSVIFNACKTTAKGRKEYTADEVDLFAVVVSTQEMYFVPFFEIGGRTRVAISTLGEYRWKGTDPRAYPARQEPKKTFKSAQRAATVDGRST